MDANSLKNDNNNTRCCVGDEAHQLLWGGEPGDVKADVKMKWGSLQISGASRSNKANEKISRG